MSFAAPSCDIYWMFDLGYITKFFLDFKYVSMLETIVTRLLRVDKKIKWNNLCESTRVISWKCSLWDCTATQIFSWVSIIWTLYLSLLTCSQPLLLWTGSQQMPEESREGKGSQSEKMAPCCTASDSARRANKNRVTWSATQIPAEPGVKENAVGPKEGWRGLEDVQLTFASRVGKQCGVFIFH